MPTFSFASQGGTSLSDRIAAINARQKAIMSGPQEEAVEEQVIKLVNEDKEELKPAEEPVILSRVKCDGSELDVLNQLVKKVDDLSTDIKKMNKHINSIVKSLKKA